MKSNWKLLFLSLSVSALLVGCEPPVDRNAETLENKETTSVDTAPVIVADPNQATDPASVIAAASEIIPEALREYTEFPKDKSSAALKKYLDSLRSPEFQAVLISALQSQDESAQIGITAARKVILENEKLAADLILGAEDATLEEYQAALQIQLDEKMGSSASVDALELEMNVIRDRVAKGRFPELAKQVDCTLNTRKLFDKGAALLQGETPKTEQVNEFYTEYTTQLEAVIAADALNEVQLQALLGLSQIFEEQPEKAVAIFEKINAALESKTDERMKQLRGMLAQQIETLKADIEIQKITPEQVKEQFAPFKVMPKEKTPSAYVAYMKTLESPEFQEVSRKMNAIRKEEVKAVVKKELDAILKNMGVAADEILKSESATEAECRDALEMKFQLALMTEEGEEALKPTQIKERFTAVQNEVKVERFPKIADAAACYVKAATVLEKAYPILQSYGSEDSVYTEEQLNELKNTLYPEVEALVKQVCDADALGGLPFQVIQSLAMIYGSDKEKVKPLLETMISVLETKTDDESKELLSNLKMQLAMIENPQSAGASEQPQKELSAEEIDALKQKLELYVKVPENATATELDAYVKSIDGPEFQNVIMPLMQMQDAKLQNWVTEIIGKLQASLINAATAICKAKDATEEQYRNALEIRLDIIRADKVRKNIEPKYAELLEEVKSGRFPALATKVELDMAAEEVMDKANAMFTNAETPSAEQLEELYAKFMPYVEKATSADALKGPQLQMIMQIASVFAEDNAKMKPICETLLKGLEGKTDTQSTQLANMFKTRLEEIQFMSEPMTFTASEGTELEELKKLVTQKMEIIMRSSTREGLPEEKLSEFLAAVEKFGNADLTAYTSWQIDLIHLIPLLMKDNLDVDAFKTKYLECVKTGTEKKLFNANCLQMCIQMVAIVGQRTSADQTNSENVKATVREMATSLLPVCEQVQGPEMEMMRQSLDSLLKGLDKADEKAETPAEEAPNTDALPETIQLDDESTEALEAPAENNVSFREEAISSSISVATTEEEKIGTVTEAMPTALDTFSVLPTDKSVEALHAFLTGAKQATYEIQSVLREMPEAEAIKAFMKVQETCATVADWLITNAETPADVLKTAVDAKIAAIVFSEGYLRNSSKSDGAYTELMKALEARNAPEMVLDVQATQLGALLRQGDRMPTVGEMTELVGKIIEICNRAKSAKCMNGDVMGRFMQMIVFANDCGVATEQIDRACQSLRESVVATEDPQLLNTADFITGIARRVALKGKPMELVGVTLDGKEVDIQKDYAGKVVLVDFWATWCNPCVMELRNLEQEYYAKYHEKGFEILGFSIDVDKNQLATFLERRKLPWRTILQKDNAVGCEEPVYYYGIQAIPCLILVGPDGKVICEIPTMRRDEVLSAELKKIYGE